MARTARWTRSRATTLRRDFDNDGRKESAAQRAGDWRVYEAAAVTREAATMRVMIFAAEDVY